MVQLEGLALQSTTLGVYVLRLSELILGQVTLLGIQLILGTPVILCSSVVSLSMLITCQLRQLELAPLGSHTGTRLGLKFLVQGHSFLLPLLGLSCHQRLLGCLCLLSGSHQRQHSCLGILQGLLCHQRHLGRLRL